MTCVLDVFHIYRVEKSFDRSNIEVNETHILRPVYCRYTRKHTHTHIFTDCCVCHIVPVPAWVLPFEQCDEKSVACGWVTYFFSLILDLSAAMRFVLIRKWLCCVSIFICSLVRRFFIFYIDLLVWNKGTTDVLYGRGKGARTSASRPCLLLLYIISFMQGIYNYVPETHHVSTVYSVAGIL